MTWLVTGGGGFVGANLADALLADGEELVLLDNLSRPGARANLAWLRDRHGDGWRLAEADVRDAGAVAALVRDARPDVVAHLAGQVAMTTSLADPRLDFEVNALGTFNVLEALRLHRPAAALLYSSTNKVYGELAGLRCREAASRYELPDFPEGLGEELPLDGSSPYGCSKLAADQYVRDYHRVYGLPTVVFRHSSIYGGRQFATADQGWVAWFCLQARAQADPAAPPFTISGDGKQVRDLLHSDDLVAVYRAAAAAIGACAGEIFNVGGGMANSLSLLELFDQLGARVGTPLRFTRLPWRHSDQKVFVADGRKARALLGWQPRVDREQGLRRAFDWAGELAQRG